MLVVEIDGHQWVATVADLDKQAIRLVDGRHGSVRADGSELDVDEIASWIVDEGHAEVPVHVVCARRELVCVHVEMPRQSAEELAANLRAEARRACALGESAPVWMAHRAVAKEKDTITHALVAMPQRGALDELVQHDELSVRSLVPTTEALLNALPDERPDDVVLASVGPGSMRVLCISAKEVQHERRAHFDGRLGLRRADAEAIEDLLAFELPLTLDYLAEIDVELPEALVCSPFLGLDEDALERVAGDLKWILTEHPVEPAVTGPARRHRPGLATIGLLRHLGTGKGELTTLTFARRDADGDAVAAAPLEPDAGKAPDEEPAAPGAGVAPEPKKTSRRPKRSRPRPADAEAEADAELDAAAEEAAPSPPRRERRALPSAGRLAMVAGVLALVALGGLTGVPGGFGASSTSTGATPDGRPTSGTLADATMSGPGADRDAADRQPSGRNDTSTPGATHAVPLTGSPAHHESPTVVDPADSAPTGPRPTHALGDGDAASQPPRLPLATYPASLLLVEACNRAPPGVLLEEISFDEATGVTIRGRTEGADWSDAMRLFGSYRQALDLLPFLSGLRESLQYRDPESGSIDLGFQLTARWSP